MKDLGITKGEITSDKSMYSDKKEASWIAVNIKEQTIAEFKGLHYGVPHNEVEHNANLFIDAHATAQKCGLLPSGLLRQRDELREALIDMVWQFAYRGTYEGRENLHTGGLSALEGAFSALGLSDPITVLDFEAAIKNTER